MGLNQGLQGFKSVWVWVILLGVAISPEQPVLGTESLCFEAPLEKSEWRPSNHLLHCELEHSIPFYGVVQFHQEAGKPLALDISVLGERVRANSEGTVQVRSPIWRKPTKEHFWKIRSDAHGQAWHLNAAQAHHVLDSLVIGKQVMLSHSAVNVGKIVRAIISPVQFRAAYARYLDCLAHLVPVDYDSVANTTIFFDTASFRLKPEDKVLLGHVAAYAAEPDIRKIEITGFTDTVGSFEANRQLSKKRVESVKQLLLSQGVLEDRVVVVLAGEHGAIESNKTKEGRAKNRRVKIRLSR